MEVQFAPELEKQLNDLAIQSGCGPAELIQDVMAGYLSEVGGTLEMLNHRYDDIKSGRVKLMMARKLSPVYTRELSRGVTAPYERLRTSP